VEEFVIATKTIPTNVSPESARDLMKSGARILDVRMPSEFETAHIPGSYNVPLDQLSEHRDELTRAVDDPVILVCASGMRAGQANNELREAGLQSLAVMDGGLNAWERAGLDIVRGRQKWTLERQVRLVAGSIVATGALGGLLVWRPLALLSLFVGGGLTFAAITNRCAMANLLSRLPYNRDASCDVRQVIDQLAEPSNR
jgi:rhodanese-related sulfurtransferase